MSDITITITGPGGVINFETIIIKRALEDAGIIVEVEDDTPFGSRPIHPLVIQETEDEYVERVTTMYRSGKIKNTVKLIAKHCPWGG